jgi:protein-tyrosine phosphatase
MNAPISITLTGSSRLSLRGVVGRALTHPLAIAVKRRLKDAMWTARGRAIDNPPVSSRVRSVLFVCKGNICRSPYAQRRFQQFLEAVDAFDVRVASAGIMTSQAAAPPGNASVAAAERGVPLDTHRPTQLTPDLMTTYDLVVVMEAGQLRWLRRAYPDRRDRIVLLSLMDNRQIGYARYHIADPFGQPIDAFRECYRRIDDALIGLRRAVRAPLPRTKQPRPQEAR